MVFSLPSPTFRTSCLAALLVIAPASRAADDTWVGAAAAVEKWKSPAQSASDETKSHPLRADLAALIAASPADHAAAADAWLALFDRWLAENPNSDLLEETRYRATAPQADSMPTLDEVLAALPGPDAWPALAQAVAARSEGEGFAGAGQRALRLLSAWLVQDDAGFRTAASEALESLKSNKNDNGHQAASLASVFIELADEGQASTSAEQLRESVKLKIEAARKNNPVYWFELPDLVTHLDDDEARALALEVLKLPIETLRIDLGDETKALVRSVATQHAAELGKPRWDLVDDIDAESVALYEALAAAQEAGEDVKTTAAEAEADEPVADQSFFDQLVGLVVGSSDPYADRYGGYDDGADARARDEARVYYLLGLIVQRRTDDAVRLVDAHFTGDGDGLTLQYGVTRTLAAAGAWEPLFNFADRMLDRPDGQAFWPMYIEAAAQIGRSDAALARAEAALAEGQDDIDAKRRARLLGLVADARLAADHVEQGIDARQQQIDALEKDRMSSTLQEVMRLHLQIAQIGHLQGRADWVDSGVAGAQAALAHPDEDGYTRSYSVQALSELLIQAGRGAQAETLLLDEVGRLQKIAARPRDDYRYRGNAGDTQEALIHLVDLYASSQRWADVRVILEQAPGWEAKDLAAIYTEAIGKRTTLGGIAAQALHEAGRDAQALEILTATLLQEAGNDALYALLVDMRGDDAAELLSRLRVRDRFEERPLIWQAHLDLNAGRLDAAEENVRAAIAIDPSDGEQGPGDRMRAYDVLGKILRARGDAESAATAEIMEGAVRAIRTAENADRFYTAGLLSRAVTLYKKSLTHFADAYCIQSRLAVRLASMGRMTEAAVHYQKAYELMPDSFGRVESHCFGCEGVFRGEEAQGVAQEVFGRLALLFPLKPQVHYLRGYLASDRGKQSAALPHYRRAVELDPDYLNAWSKIQGLSGHMQLSRTDRDEAILNIFRLDPLGRHAQVNMDTVGDIAGAWRAVEKAQPLRVEPPVALLVLGKQAASAGSRQARRRFLGSTRHRQALMTPGEMLVAHQVTTAVRQILEAQAQPF